MIGRILIVLAWLAFFPFLSVAQDNGANLTKLKNGLPFDGDILNLPRCYELALLRMETVGLSEEDVKIAQARYREAVGAILPSVKVIGE